MSFWLDATPISLSGFIVPGFLGLLLRLASGKPQVVSVRMVSSVCVCVTGIHLDCTGCAFRFLAGECGVIVGRTQRSFHNHGIPSLINSAYLQV